ncbi:helix-turn-helix domain-containing protein [Shimia sediminis]|uniref:helix-turn-helix domain-containing protein n=1 Tax=Shimia sediminis TaxID=2497945 RepID=UPI000F8DF0E7|nr:helix-turn-helix domain-containing protein [Shimia sediminis]
MKASFCEIDEMLQALRAWDAELSPLSAANRGQIVASFVQTIDGPLQYMYSEFAFALSMVGAPPEGLVTFNIMEPTVPRYWVRGHDVDSNWCWVFPVGKELRSFSSPGFKVHTLSVTEDDIHRTAAALELDLAPASLWPEAFALPPAQAQQVRHLMRALGTAPMGAVAGVARDILMCLLPHWQGATHPARDTRPSLRARDLAVQNGLAFLATCDLTSTGLGDLRDNCHVSERTLQYAFRERFGMSPAAFLKRNKLARVRARLRQADVGTCAVSDVASEFGFWHLGQFSVDYRKLFAEKPSETLAAHPC